MNKRVVVVMAVVVMWGGVARGQVGRRDFYDRGGVGLFNPEIGVVASGPMMVVRPTVSQDNKYVTLGMQAALTQVVRIQNFPVMTIGWGGFVGGVQPAGAGNGPGGVGNGNVSTPSRRNDVGAMLNQPGITWIAPP